jgi:DNA (cytosine-5)-methyltransferase 1
VNISNGDAVPHVVAFAFHPKQDPISGSVSPAIGGTTAGMGVVCTTGAVTHSLTHEGADASEDGTGRGTPIVVGVDIAPTLTSRDFKGAASYFNGAVSGMVYPDARPRRLTPVECERLMGWHPGWTATGTREDGTPYALSDTARYRLCGNGVGSPQAAWIARRLALALTQDAVRAAS